MSEKKEGKKREKQEREKGKERNSWEKKGCQFGKRSKFPRKRIFVLLSAVA